MENGTVPQGDGRDPSSFLGEIIGNPVTVKLNSGVVYKGELQSVDGYMNIALERCEEHVNGVKKRSYGDAFVRGNNGGDVYLGGHMTRREDRMEYMTGPSDGYLGLRFTGGVSHPTLETRRQNQYSQESGAPESELMLGKWLSDVSGSSSSCP